VGAHIDLAPRCDSAGRSVAWHSALGETLIEIHKVQVMRRSEAAALMRRIADQLEEGRLTRSGAPAKKLPDEVRFKVDMDPRELEIDIRW
jgi:hypothetical protein